MSVKPTHRLKVLDKRNSRWAEIGAGWKNEDGSISVVLNPCTMLGYDPELVVTLFPVGDKPKTKAEPKKIRRAL